MRAARRDEAHEDGDSEPEGDRVRPGVDAECGHSDEEEQVAAQRVGPAERVDPHLWRRHHCEHTGEVDAEHRAHRQRHAHCRQVRAHLSWRLYTNEWDSSVPIGFKSQNFNQNYRYTVFIYVRDERVQK